MARQRGFDEDEAVAAAGRLFTARGYEGTSVDDLVVGLGVHRGSLYRTFGSKLELFHRALRTHVDGHLLPWIATLRDAPDGPLVAAAAGNVDVGLLLVATVERAPTDPVVAADVARVVAALAAVLTRDTADPVDGPDTGSGLAAAVIGLRLLARTGTPEDEIATAARALSGRPNAAGHTPERHEK